MENATDRKSTNISKAKNINEVLEIASGNWNAYPIDIMTNSGIGLPDHKAILRSDNNYPLGIVGTKYELINNNEAFSFFDALVTENKAEYKSYREFDGGRKSVITARYNQNKAIRIDDHVESEITLINSFDGSTSFKVMFSALRLACTNGMVSRDKMHTISVRHTKNKNDRLQDALKVLTSAENSWQVFLNNCEQMNQKAIDTNMVETFINSLVGIDLEAEKEPSARKLNTAEKITELVYDGKGNKGESVWDLYNGATEYYDHYIGSNDSNREKSSLFGDSFNKKAKALELALALTE